MSMRAHLGSFALIAAGCAANEPPARVPPTPQPTPSPSESAVPPEPQPPTDTSQADASPAVDAAIPFPDTVFPPKDINPPYERSARKGDGHWERIGNADKKEKAANEPPIVYRTVVRPHSVSKWITVTLAAIALRHVSLHLVAGKDDPKAEKLPNQDAIGLVPKEDHADLVAVFNGGFKPQHGGWGMKIQGKELVPPRAKGCTVIMNPDSTVRIRSWQFVSEDAPNASSYRQTPPCLLESRAVHPDLIAGNDRAWAGRDAKRKTRRRSAIGVDESGRTLYFGVGVEADPKLLAEAMLLAGASSAAQLDINWSWTRFLLFGTVEGKLQVTSTLIPQMMHRKRGYVFHSQPRDFFYLKRK